MTAKSLNLSHFCNRFLVNLKSIAEMIKIVMFAILKIYLFIDFQSSEMLNTLIKQEKNYSNNKNVRFPNTFQHVFLKVLLIGKENCCAMQHSCILLFFIKTLLTIITKPYIFATRFHPKQIIIRSDHIIT